MIAPGLFVVACLAVAAWFGGQKIAHDEFDNWTQHRYAVIDANLDRAINGQVREPEPEPSWVVQHPNIVSAGASIATAVTGTIVVLLFSINSSLQRKEPSPQR